MPSIDITPSRSLITGPSAKRAPSSVIDCVDERVTKKPKLQESVSRESTSAAKEKKRRRKKKKKVSVVQNELDTTALADSSATPSSSGSAQQRHSEIPETSCVVEEETLEPGPAGPSYGDAPGGSQTSVSPEPDLQPSSAFLPLAASFSSSYLPQNNPEPSERADGPMSISRIVNNKGKSRAVDDTRFQETTNVQLNQDLSAKSQLVSRHEALLTQFQQSLTCQICLDLLHKPYALAPCGHVACYDCLVNWFTAGPPDVHPEDVPPAIARRKTCPHCRAVVKERPAEVWAVKEMVGMLIKSNLVEGLVVPTETVTSVPAVPWGSAASQRGQDPWAGIFRGGIGSGGFPALPPMFAPGPPPPIGPPAGDGQHVGNMGVYDGEDGGVWRCTHCLHEIWDGECSYCGAVYDGHPDWHDVDDLGDSEDSVWEGLSLGRDDGANGRLGVGEFEHAQLVDAIFGAGDDEDSYDGSFIDDDDDDDDYDERIRFMRSRLGSRDGRRGASSSSDREDERPHVNAIDQPRSEESWHGGSAQGAIVISSPSDDDEQRSHVAANDRSSSPAPSHRRRRAIYIASDSDSSDGETNERPGEADLADRMAARERLLYGDDGSVARRPTWSARFSPAAPDSPDHADMFESPASDDDPERGRDYDESVASYSDGGYDSYSYGHVHQSDEEEDEIEEL